MTDCWSFSLRKGQAYDSDSDSESESNQGDASQPVNPQTRMNWRYDGGEEDIQYKPSPWTIAKLHAVNHNSSNPTSSSMPSSDPPTISNSSKSPLKKTRTSSVTTEKKSQKDAPTAVAPKPKPNKSQASQKKQSTLDAAFIKQKQARAPSGTGAKKRLGTDQAATKDSLKDIKLTPDGKTPSEGRAKDLNARKDPLSPIDPSSSPHMKDSPVPSQRVKPSTHLEHPSYLKIKENIRSFNPPSPHLESLHNFQRDEPKDRATTLITLNQAVVQATPSSFSQSIVAKKNIIPFRTPFLSQSQSQARERLLMNQRSAPKNVYPRSPPQQELDPTILIGLSSPASSPTSNQGLNTTQAFIPLNQPAPTPIRPIVKNKPAPKSSFVASLIQETLACPPSRSTPNPPETQFQSQPFAYPGAPSSTPSLSHTHSASTSSAGADLILGPDLARIEYDEDEELYGDDMGVTNNVRIGKMGAGELLSSKVVGRYEAGNQDEYDFVENHDDGPGEMDVYHQSGGIPVWHLNNEHKAYHQNDDPFITHTLPPLSQSRKRIRSESLSPDYQPQYRQQSSSPPPSPSPPPKRQLAALSHSNSRSRARPLRELSSLPIPSAPRKQTSSRLTRPISAYTPRLSSDRDEELWSTLPASKSKKGKKDAGRGGGILSTGRFKLPTLTTPNSLAGGAGGTGTKRSGSGKRTVKGFRPPPPRDHEKEKEKSTDDEDLEGARDEDEDGVRVGGGWKLVMIANK